MEENECPSPWDQENDFMSVVKPQLVTELVMAGLSGPTTYIVDGEGENS